MQGGSSRGKEMRILAYVFAVLIGAVVGTLGYEYSMPVHAALHCTTRTCVVTYNPGGGLVVQCGAAWTGMEYSYPKVPTTAPMRTAKTYARMRISFPLDEHPCIIS